MRRNVLEYLEETAARLPEKAAFVDGQGAWTFARLLEASRRIGTCLARTAGPGQTGRPVAVLADRTAVSIAGFMGALQAGCCYVPLDARAPLARLEAVLDQLRPAAVLYAARDEKTASALAHPAPVIELEAAMECPADGGLLAAVRERVLDVDPAYIIFTSGSTGTPKGIVISHRSLIDFAEWMGPACGITEEDVLGNQAPFTFDLSVKDIYMVLRCGATAHILSRETLMFPLLLTDYLRQNGVTTLIWATSAFRMMAASGVLEREPPACVRKVIVGGEAMQAVHLNAWRRALPGARFINLYGPTEVTVDCTWFPVEREYADGQTIPIGRPCGNMDVLLLDEQLRPVAAGEAGEICVRGSGLASGYFGDWERTQKAFIQNPLRPDYPDRLYRTGDLARLDENGDLIFLGRRDGQVKHMGYRIELGDVEAAVCAIPGVEGAACLLDGRTDRIVCFCQTEASPDFLAAEAKKRMQKFMTPNIWRVMERLPVNRSGKIDRAGLKEMYFAEG